MQEVPKIALRRLPRVAAAEAHPDANLLAAFAEQSLGESERARMMEHLARCGDCRDAVSLALPAEEAVAATASASVVSSRWFALPVRWGVVAAGILLVTSAGVLKYRHSQQQSVALVSSGMPQERKPLTTTQSSSPQVVEQQALVILADETAEKKANKKNASVLARRELSADKLSSANTVFPTPSGRANSAVANAGSAAGSGGGFFRPDAGGSGAETVSSDSAAFAPAAKNKLAAVPNRSQQARETSNAIPPSSQMVDVEAEPAEVAENRGISQGLELQRDAAVSTRNANSDVVKAKEIAPAKTGSAAPAAPMPLAAKARVLAASPRWAISSDGALRRSIDNGQTWEDANLSAASFAGGVQLQSTIESNTAYAGKSPEKSSKKQTSQSASAPVFRAVASIDSEVWAGGSGAMLYHSADSGMHWVRVLPSEAGAAVTGDIVSIEFADQQSGRIATSSGEVWTTGDAGQSWHRQQ
jgi:hypothetical protein